MYWPVQAAEAADERIEALIRLSSVQVASGARTVAARVASLPIIGRSEINRNKPSIVTTPPDQPPDHRLPEPGVIPGGEVAVPRVTLDCALYAMQAGTGLLLNGDQEQTKGARLRLKAGSAQWLILMSAPEQVFGAGPEVGVMIPAFPVRLTAT